MHEVEENAVPVTGGGPLQGIRVIDFTTNVSGPSATAILADLGADVIKIEREHRGDDARGMNPKVHGESAYFLAINRNKRSIALDFTTPEGQAVVWRLLDTADVLIENFKRGTLERYGFGAIEVRSKYPNLIYCSLSSYGEQGPDANKAGYDAVLQARTGIMSITGSRIEEPSRAGVSILDAGSAMWAALGIVSALFHRNRTGEGQVVGTSLFETGVYWMNYHLAAYQGTQRDPMPQGASHMAFAPYGNYRTADDFILIGISNDRLFSKLVDTLLLPELKNDPRFFDNNLRVENRIELDGLIQERLLEHGAGYWIDKLAEAAVPCSSIQRVSQVLRDRQLEALGMLQQMEVPEPHKSIHIPLIPIRMEKSPVRLRRPAPKLGEHGREVFAELGLDTSLATHGTNHAAKDEG